MKIFSKIGITVFIISAINVIGALWFFSLQTNNQSLLELFFFAIPFIVLESLAIFALFFTVLHPLIAIAKTAKDIAQGNFSKKVIVNTPDEIGEISSVFNMLTTKLEDYYKNYASNVTEKNDQLANKIIELQRLNRTMMGREYKMIELKKEVDELKAKLGESERTEFEEQVKKRSAAIQQLNTIDGYSKEAMLNLLEDLQSSVSKVNQEKNQDEAILESIGDGVIITDREGRIVMINPSTQTMLGYNLEECLKKAIDLIIPMQYENGKTVPKNDIPVFVALSSGKKVATTAADILFYITKTGTKLPVAITVTPVMVENHVVGTITIFRDTTKEREVDRMKTEFISLASHQLRTPLSAMKWFSEMLVDGDVGSLTSEQMEIIKNIHQSNERMIALVNSLLNISRIESGRIIINPIPTDLKELVKEVINDIQAKIRERKQKLIISVNDNLPKINIDPKLIRQVYMNLLTNAIKYSPPEHEITILISKNQNEIISQISDQGYGIPQNEENKLFQKFYRGENIVKIETDGTGLGLYLVKAIVESSGGKIWFKSEENKGTTFWFSLPLAGSIAKQGEVTLDS